MAFHDQSVLNLLETIEKDKSIGGVCGRTVPISVRSHPIVWLQKFEYARGKLELKLHNDLRLSVNVYLTCQKTSNANSPTWLCKYYKHTSIANKIHINELNCAVLQR